ncbi:MAG: ectoine/hydroxyectoine ABC transporter permease subunit EhuC [Actinomycetota bacterium]
MVSGLVSGLTVTLQLFFLGAVVVAVVAPLAGLARLSKSRFVRVVAGTYVEVFRGTSVLVQLYFAFFVLPIFGVEISPLVAGTMVLGLNVGAYGSEIVRGAVMAVPSGQVDAAIVIGMSPWLRMRRVIFPQAFVTMLPSISNLLIDLLKVTSVASLIGLADITFEARNLRRFVAGAGTLQLFTAVMVLYFVLAYLISGSIRLLEARLSRGRDIGRAGRIGRVGQRVGA